MADVQIDNGEYTRIANILLEKVSAAKLNGCQSALILVIIRYTYGFQRKEHDLSPSFLSTATGYDKRQIQREISKLVFRNIITQKSKNGITRKLGLNKDFDTWDIATYGKLADGEYTDGRLADGQNAVGTYGENADGTYGKLADQERNKENSKKTIIYIPFVEIIDYLNLKAGTKYKSSSKSTQKHIQARWNDKYAIPDFQIVIDKKCAEWLGTDMEKYLCPDTLFGTKFEKYLNQKIVLKGGQADATRTEQRRPPVANQYYANDAPRGSKTGIQSAASGGSNYGDPECDLDKLFVRR